MNEKFVHVGRLAEKGVRAKVKNVSASGRMETDLPQNPKGHLSLTPGFSPVMGTGGE
jgi:hypothetical protein